MSSDLLALLFMCRLFAVHRNIFATQKDWKKCKKTQEYESDMKEETNLVQDVGERSVLRKEDAFTGSPIYGLYVPYSFAWIHSAMRTLNREERNR